MPAANLHPNLSAIGFLAWRLTITIVHNWCYAAKFSTKRPAASPIKDDAVSAYRISRILPKFGITGKPATPGKRNPEGQYTKIALPIRLYRGTVPS